jgi:outer membrane protein TolC
MAPGPGGPGGPTAVPQTPAPGGPEPAAGQVRLVSLPQALDIALGQQPNIQARLYDYAAARYRVDQAISPMLPQLNASWDVATGQIAVIQRTNVVTKDRRDVTEARLSLSQLLFDFGKNLAATEVQKRLADVAKEDIEVQRDLIALAVKEAYFNLLFAKRLIVVNRQSVERAELNLRSARGFFEVGTRPKSDVTRAEVDVANARVDTIRATNAEKLARVALNTAMGISIDTPTEVENILTYHPLNVESGQLLSEALRQRAEYRQAKLRVDAAEATVKQQIRNFFPDLVGNAFYGGSGFALTEVWEIGASLNWNIFDGGNKIARLRESRALLSGAQVRVQATQLDIWQQVEQALVTVREAEERIQATGKAVESAAENFRLAQGRFDAGVGTILEVTDAQLALTQAQNTESQALADFRIAVSRLERALGRR